MNRKNMLYLTFVLLVGLISLWGCPKKAEITSSPEAQEEKVTAPATPPVGEAGTGGKSFVSSNSDSEEAKELAQSADSGLQPIYFDYDRSAIRDDSKPVMEANAEWLKTHPTEKIVVEGNCDERGTKEYNIALGQRRAASAKKYLTDLGVSTNRISLVGYGKERPVCAENTEECWQKNRRDHFVVAQK